jgi:hypothetical protein
MNASAGGPPPLLDDDAELLVPAALPHLPLHRRLRRWLLFVAVFVLVLAGAGLLLLADRQLPALSVPPTATLVPVDFPVILMDGTYFANAGTLLQHAAGSTCERYGVYGEVEAGSGLVVHIRYAGAPPEEDLVVPLDEQGRYGACLPLDSRFDVLLVNADGEVLGGIVGNATRQTGTACCLRVDFYPADIP